MNRKALTLLEIIISMVILALVMTGLVNVFVAGKGFVQHSRLRMSAGEIGKKFVDPLQAYVRQDTWDTNPLGTKNVPDSTNGVYTAKYAVTDHPSDNNIKKVKVTVQWPLQ